MEEKKYGCHCELFDGDNPDECVIDLGESDNCVWAQKLGRAGKGRNDCQYWQEVKTGSTLQDEVDRLTTENANLRATVRGKTMYHSDEDVNREMGRLRAENAKLREALKGMVALWERVHENHGPVLLGKPTLNIARQALKEAE